MAQRPNRPRCHFLVAQHAGYTATAAANLLLDGLFAETGVIPPEKLGQAPGCCEYMLDYLAARGVHYATSERAT